MRVLSLFDGMACGMLAMQVSGIHVDRYVAFEIDKYAVKTSSHNFPMIEHRGDVFQADFTEFSGFDYLVGGSPCTYWSIAQKNNRETVASGMGWELFSQYVRALHEAQPMYFIYENNKSMSKAIRESITQTFGFEPICINSALVSAQNRQRLYWVGKRNPDGTYSKVHVDQPEDRGILLRDVLDGMASKPFGECSDKAYALTASYWKWQPKNKILEKSQRSHVAEPVCMRYERSEEAKAVRKQYEAGIIKHGFREYAELHPRTDGKSNTLSTVLKDNPICEPVRIPEYGNEDKARPIGAKYMPNSGGFEHRMFSDNPNKQQVDMIAELVRVGAGGKTALYAIPVEFDGEIPTKAVSLADGKTYTVYQVIDGQITIKGKQYPIKLADGFYIIRKLTVSECKRLQTVPEWYEFPVSDTQAYKMLGNGWTVEVIAHLINATMAEADEEEQLDLFAVGGAVNA